MHAPPASSVGTACAEARPSSPPTSYTAGVLVGGRLFAWGANHYFQVGGGPEGPAWVYTPELASAVGANVVLAQVAGSTLVVDAAGDVRGFGWNGQGQLGVGATGGPDVCSNLGMSCHATPTASKVSGVAELRFGDHWCGGAHVCARHADRSVSCWGDLGGACGVVKTAVAPQPVALPSPSAGLAVTYSAHCARACDGSVSCWGANDKKQLGVDAPAKSPTPVAIPGLRLTQIAAGFEHFCGIDEAGDVLCWGTSGAGQSGAIGDTLPTKVLGVSHAIQLALGHAVSCALTDQGTVHCWGAFSFTGVPDLAPSCVKDACPSAVGAAASGIVEIGGGAGAILARRADGTFVAWGNNTDAMLGDGTKSNVPAQTPASVLGLPPAD